MSTTLKKDSTKPKKAVPSRKVSIAENGQKIKKKRHSSRARMRSNIRKAQLSTTPALETKAYGTILRIARAYMTSYREDPKISKPAAKVLIHDLDAYIHNVMTEACVRARLNASSDGMPTLSIKHLRAVMDNNNFRRSQQACYIPIPTATISVVARKKPVKYH